MTCFRLVLIAIFSLFFSVQSSFGGTPLFQSLKSWKKSGWSSKIDEWNSLRSTKPFQEGELFGLRAVDDPTVLPFGFEIFTNERALSAFTKDGNHVGKLTKSRMRILERRAWLHRGSEISRRRGRLTHTTTIWTPDFTPFEKIGLKVDELVGTLDDLTYVRARFHSTLDSLERSRFADEGIPIQFEKFIQSVGKVDAEMHSITDSITGAIDTLGAHIANGLNEDQLKSVTTWFREIQPFFNDLAEYTIWLQDAKRMIERVGTLHSLDDAPRILDDWLHKIKTTLLINPAHRILGRNQVYREDVLETFRNLFKSQPGDAIEFIFIERLLGHIEWSKIYLAFLYKVSKGSKSLNRGIIDLRENLTKNTSYLYSRKARMKLTPLAAEWRKVRIDIDNYYALRTGVDRRGKRVQKLIHTGSAPIVMHPGKDGIHKRVLYIDEMLAGLLKELDHPQERSIILLNLISDIKSQADGILTANARWVGGKKLIEDKQVKTAHFLSNLDSKERERIIRGLNIRIDLADIIREIIRSTMD